jgi:hypothetical protein
MSFETIEKKHGAAQAKGVAVGAGRYSQGIAVRIRFAPDVLNAMDWSPGRCLGLAYGTGRHAGKLRIGLDELNGLRLQNNGLRDRSKFLVCTRIGDGKKHPSQSAPHKISNGYLYIDLPDWALPADRD